MKTNQIVRTWFSYYQVPTIDSMECDQKSACHEKWLYGKLFSRFRDLFCRTDSINLFGNQISTIGLQMELPIGNKTLDVVWIGLCELSKHMAAQNALGIKPIQLLLNSIFFGGNALSILIEMNMGIDTNI